MLCEYEWFGNVCELENVCWCMVVLVVLDIIGVVDVDSVLYCGGNLCMCFFGDFG